MTVSDFPDWQGFGIQNVPLYAASSQVIAANASATQVLNSNGNYVTPMTAYNSFDLSMYLACAVASTFPFMRIRFVWAYDVNLQFVSYSEYWVVPASSAPGTIQIIGNGPVRGAYLGIVVDNFDGTNSMTINTLNIIGTTRPCPVTSSDLRTISNPGTVPTVTLPQRGNGIDGVLGWWHGSLAASATINLMAALFNGPSYVAVTVTGTSPNLTVAPSAPMNPTGLAAIDQVYVIGTVADSESWLEYLPRMPLVLELTNNNATNSVTYTVSVMANVTL